jgi:hypothetical protein
VHHARLSRGLRWQIFKMPAEGVMRMACGERRMLELTGGADKQRGRRDKGAW